MWEALFTAVALVLVIEGILPFLSPQKWRSMMQRVTHNNDHVIRMIGLTSMIVGAILMTLTHAVFFD